MEHEGEIATEGFSAWLRRVRRALRTGEAVAVPCGDCRGCCTSSYFVHIDADETASLAAVPDELKFPVPGQESGGAVLGYDRRGHCPMFDGHGCSIYERRPRTCRVYDCRVFTATGLTVGDERPVIARRATRFRFDLSGAGDRAELAAVRAAARFLIDHATALPAGFVPENPTQQAVVALKVYEAFLAPTSEPRSGHGDLAGPQSVASQVAATVAAYARFRTGGAAD
jgi:uncharacterized protein